jgi:WhiB family redox-sensing transcriptional regulator
MMRCVTAAEGYRENWRKFAACLSAEPELFFPAASAGLDDRQVERAKAVCKVCPVRRECLQFALATRQSHGVWGGMSERERRVARMPVPA